MARASVPPKFFLIIEEIERISKLNGTWAKKQRNIFLGLWENITSSQTLLLKVTHICCFSTFLARADPRGSCTIPSVVGKRIQLISHASIVQKTLFSPHPLSLTTYLTAEPLWVIRVLGLTNASRIDLPCSFPNFQQSFSRLSVQSNYKQSFSRLPFQFNLISISLFQDFVFLLFFIFV